jgi:cysteine desulfurase
MFDKITYLDNAASTRLDERVLEAMKPYFFDSYAVATSEFGYSMGIDAKEGLMTARGSIAKTLGASAEELVFTSGETESSNMAIKGVTAALRKKKGSHVISRKRTSRAQYCKSWRQDQSGLPECGHEGAVN